MKGTELKLSTTTRTAALAMALSGSLALAACGASNESDSGSGGGGGGADLSGELVGAGASSQQAAMEAWQAGFEGEAPDVRFSYDPAGSGAGREQFIAGSTAFAGSDAALDDEELTHAQERCAGGEVFELPNYISPIASCPQPIRRRHIGPTISASCRCWKSIRTYAPRGATRPIAR